jgi:hypothetical protein
VKGSVFTTKTWFLLLGAALLICAAVLNFTQRARHETPSSDGIEWTDTSQGIIARSIERNSAGERAWLLPGDRLIGISLDPNAKPDEISHARDVQIYLDQARVGERVANLRRNAILVGNEQRAYQRRVPSEVAVHDFTGAPSQYPPPLVLG